ncbi:ubiquitin-like domain-containing protein [Arthrobacter sp. BL-252-APC-1A]|uniref:ubiquitin-like domain-containing protein n=1 Tax=Arthrobacter TaxID=1663 RepID=UPI002DDA67A3|nr:ubiquitin-like domain-containing protein [Arthrobacter sp. BL-252-APC-1A]
MATAIVRRGLKLGGQAAVMVALILGLVAFVGTNKSVVLNVDGETSDIITFGGTVEDVLAKADIQLAAADRVVPAASTEVQDGTTIEVTTAKTVDVNVDGTGHTIQTTGATVADLISELRVSAKSSVSASLDTSLLSLQGLSISTPKTVTLLADGQTRQLETTAGTVGEVLAEAGIAVGSSDRLSVPARADVADGMTLKVTRVVSGTEDTVTEPVPFETRSVEDAELFEGEKKVTEAGAAGERILVFDTVVVDGREVSRVLVREDVTREPVTETVAVGTKKRPAPAPAAAPGGTAPAGGAWAALAQCESGGNWHINSGNGYYGGLQFSTQSWLGAGGGAYAPVASDATPEQQIAVAENLRANGGWGHWPSCARKLGLL